MPDEALLRDKVITYLNGLSPAARSMLLRRLEASGGGIDGLGDMKIILDAARHLAAAPDPQVAVGDVKTRFFAPYAAYVIAEMLPVKQPGWLAQSSLDGIWAHLTREVMPDAFRPWIDPAAIAGYTGAAEIEAAVRGLRQRALVELERQERASAEDAKLRQRFVSRLGGERVRADLLDMFAMTDRLPAIERLLGRLPASAASGEPSERLLADQVAAHVADRPEDATWAAVAISGRIASSGMMARVAIAIAGTDDIQEVRRSAGAVFVDVGLAGTERSLVRVQRGLREHASPTALASEIRRFHESVRLMTGALRFEEDAMWRNRLAGLRRDLSQAIIEAVEGLVPTLRRGLRADMAKGPSEIDGADAARGVALFAAARRCRETLAVNELVTRLAPVLEQALEVSGRELIEHLRKLRPGEVRNAHVAASELMLQMAEHLHGEEYAGLLRKSRDNALARPTGAQAAG